MKVKNIVLIRGQEQPAKRRLLHPTLPPLRKSQLIGQFIKEDDCSELVIGMSACNNSAKTAQSEQV